MDLGCVSRCNVLFFQGYVTFPSLFQRKPRSTTLSLHLRPLSLFPSGVRCSWTVCDTRYVYAACDPPAGEFPRSQSRGHRKAGNHTADTSCPRLLSLVFLPLFPPANLLPPLLNPLQIKSYRTSLTLVVSTRASVSRQPGGFRTHFSNRSI